MSQSDVVRPSDRLISELDALATDAGLPSLVVADSTGLLVASASKASEVEEVAALSALRAQGDERRSEVATGRVKARSIDIGDDVMVVGALGDTAVCAPVFDRVEEAVRKTMSGPTA